MKQIKFNLWVTFLLIMSAVQVGLVGCKDDPGVENYYTQVREYASDYLQNREQYSDYLQILQRATGERGDLRLVDMLGTYGAYTIFAPTNDAIGKYLHSRGLTSIEELSKEDCDTIALNSIIDGKAYFTTDDDCGSMIANMLERKLNFQFIMEWDEDTQDSVPVTRVNSAYVLHENDSVSNGVVHTVGELVGASNELVGGLILKDSTCLIYIDAFRVTHMIDSLEYDVDDTYGWASDQDRIDSCTWTNDKLCIPTAKDANGGGGEYDNVAYPEKRYFNFTVFMCPDSILKEKYGITDLDGLRIKARELYLPVYPEDADVTDETDRRNYLNRFISYHILDRYGEYGRLTSDDGLRLPNNFNRRKYDICDWYETMMPYSIMKFSSPSGSQAGLYINRRGVQSRADERGVFIRGTKVMNPKDFPNTDFYGTNGVYHYIDDIIAYDEVMQKTVMNDVIRTDGTTLSPDFMTKLTDGQIARGHYWRGGEPYSSAVNSGVAANNPNRSIGFKPGYARNYSYSDNTHMHVRGRSLYFWSYEGDEIIFKGRYDFTVKLPPVPPGTYELRMMTCVGFATRGIIQYYIDGEPQGIPFDMRPGGVSLFGYQSDATLGDDDAIAAFDKSIHNLGWMKGPKCYHCGDRTSFEASSATMRDQDNTIRRVVGTFQSFGKENHYLRIQQKMESENNELNLDFIEIVPSSVYNNEYMAEPLW